MHPIFNSLLRHSKTIIGLTVLSFVFGQRTSAEPSSLVVRTNSDTELRETLSRGGNVTFDFNGDITLTNVIEIKQDVSLDGSNHQIRIKGGEQFQIFRVLPGVTFKLKNLTVTEGYITAIHSEDIPQGAAVYNEGTFIASGCSFSNNIVFGGHGGALGGPQNIAAYGGAIASTGTLILTDTQFYNNEVTGGEIQNAGSTIYGAPAFGGALYIKGGQSFLTNCLFALNRVHVTINTRSPGQMAAGGGIYFANGIFSVDRCRFEANSVLGGEGFDAGGPARGGGLYLAAGQGQILRSQFAGNAVVSGSANFYGFYAPPGTADGGGIYIDSATASVDQTALVGNIVHASDSTQNTPSSSPGQAAGGGLFNKAGSVSLENCTISQNQTLGSGLLQPVANDITGGNFGGDAKGAGISNEGSMTVQYSTVAGNTNNLGVKTINGSKVGEGIYSTGQLTIGNSIVAYNTNGNFQGNIIDAGHNISSDSSGHFTSSLENIDPLLGPLSDNGGLTLSIAPLDGSPAIDAAVITGPKTDQIGNLRPFGNGFDIGAFERSASGALTLDFRLQNGNIAVSFNGLPGRIYDLKKSEDLGTWTPAKSTATDETGNGVFNFPIESNHQFFTVSRRVIPADL